MQVKEGEKINGPILMKDGATRVSIHADSSLSLATESEGREMRESERVVGIWRALIAERRINVSYLFYFLCGLMKECTFCTEKLADRRTEYGESVCTAREWSPACSFKLQLVC
jgi:hypothetical protein